MARGLSTIGLVNHLTALARTTSHELDGILKSTRRAGIAPGRERCMSRPLNVNIGHEFNVRRADSY